MPYFAAVLSRSGGRWASTEIDLDEADDLDDVAEIVRDEAQGASPALLFVEENDEWFGIVRVDGEDDPETFISDIASVEMSDTAQMLFGGAAEDVDIEADDESGDGAGEQSARPTTVPGGSAELLADLGLPGAELLALCAAEGQLPIDVVATVWERLGAGDEIEALR